MKPINPYEPPAVLDSSPGFRDSGGDNAVPGAIIRLMQQTRPWVSFLGILGFIAAGLMVLVGVGMTLSGAFAKNKLPAAMGWIYVLLAVLYIFPSWFLYQYGAAIKRLAHSGGFDALTEALSRQKSFWRLVGIATAVMMILYAVGIAGAVVFGVAGALKH